MFGRSGAVVAAAAVVVVVAGSGAASAVPVRAAHSGASHLTAGRKVATVSKVAPEISSLSPSKTRVGKHVEVLGRHLNEATEVLVHGRRARFHIVSSRRLTVLVPKRSTSGRVTVKASGESVSSPKPLAITQSVSPDAASSAFTFSPNHGPIGTTVTITASGSSTFSLQGCLISFGGSPQTHCTVVSSTVITAVVSAGAITGPISFYTGSPLGAGTGPNYASTSSFRVTLGIALSTQTGPPGTSTTVGGAGFGADEAVDLYAGSTDVGLVTADDNGDFSTSVTIPATAQPGAINVTAVGRRTEDSTGAAFTVNTDWAQDGFGSGNTNDNPFEDTIGPDNVGQLGSDLVKPLPTNGGSLDPIEVGGNYLIISAESITGNQISETLSAITPAGSTVWSFAPGTGIGDVQAGNGDAFVLTGTEIYALQAATGAVLWQQPLTGFASSSFTGSPLLVYAGKVFVTSSGGGSTQSVTAFDAGSGATDWTTSVTTASISLVAAGGGSLFADENNVLVSISAGTGSQGVSFSSTCPDTVLSAAYSDGVVYLSCEGASSEILAADAATGTLLWSASETGYSSSIALAGGTLFANIASDGSPTGTATSSVVALNTATGQQSWQSTVPDLDVKLTAADGLVYCSGDSYSLTALDAATGKPLWRDAVSAGTNLGFSPAIVSNGIVAVIDNNVNAFDTFDLAGGRVAAQARRSSARPLRPTYAARVR